MDRTRQNKTRLYRWAWLCALVGMMAVMWLAAGAASAAELAGSTTVFYQVTYKDRTIKNLPDPPKSDEGILMVMRFIRTESALPGYQTASTGNQQLEVLNPTRTQQTQLKWDGKAWAEAVKLPKPDAQVAKKPQPIPGPSPADQANVSASTAKDRLQKIMELMSIADRAVRQAEAQLTVIGSAPDALAKARKALHEARLAQQQTVSMIISLKGRLPQTAAAPAPPVVEKKVIAVAPPDPPKTPAAAPDRPRPLKPTLSTDVFVSGYSGEWNSCNYPTWPYFGNIGIHTERPNPDYDVGPRVIIREQK